MSTIIDLNTARTITYNDQANYAIVFGANAGNITANVDAYATANITQQTTLTSITSPVRDLLLDVQFSNVGNVSMAYVGPYSNIGLIQTAPSAWRVSGIRSVAQYTEAFANVKYSDLTGGFAANPDYSYVTTVSDQDGNVRTWTTSVNVIAQPTLSVTGNVIYNEDTLTNVTVANVLVDAGSSVTFRLYANTVPTYGSMTDGVVTGNSIFIDGNATSLNSQITAGGLKFMPKTDFVSNVGNAINFSLGNTTTVLSTANANIQIANTNPEITNMISRTYYSNTVNQIFSTTTPYINDGGDYGQLYTITLSSGLGQFGTSIGTLANTYTSTGTMGQINSEFTNMKFAPFKGIYGNSTFTYTQSRAGVNQANITANLTGVRTDIANTSLNYTSSGTRTFTPTGEQILYQTADVWVIGAGGGSCGLFRSTNTPTDPQGAGGGGGGVIYTANVGITNTTYTITVGAGGAGGVTGTSYGACDTSGSAGGSTTALGYTAGGGGGAQGNHLGVSNTQQVGGVSGAPQSNAGGLSTVSNCGVTYGAFGYAGGGGGAGGAGNSAPCGGGSNNVGGAGGIPYAGTNYGRGGSGYSPASTPTYSYGSGGQTTSYTSGDRGNDGAVLITFHY